MSIISVTLLLTLSLLFTSKNQQLNSQKGDKGDKSDTFFQKIYFCSTDQCYCFLNTQ